MSYLDDYGDGRVAFCRCVNTFLHAVGTLVFGYILTILISTIIATIKLDSDDPLCSGSDADPNDLTDSTTDCCKENVIIAMLFLVSISSIFVCLSCCCCGLLCLKYLITC